MRKFICLFEKCIFQKRESNDIQNLIIDGKEFEKQSNKTLKKVLHHLYDLLFVRNIRSRYELKKLVYDYEKDIEWIKIFYYYIIQFNFSFEYKNKTIKEYNIKLQSFLYNP